MNGIERLCADLGLWGMIIIPISNKSLSEQLSGNDDEFVHRTAYEKVESELEERQSESEALRGKIAGLENLVSYLKKDKERLLKETQCLSESLGRVSVELAKLKLENDDLKIVIDFAESILKGSRTLDEYYSKIIDENFANLI